MKLKYLLLAILMMALVSACGGTDATTEETEATTETEVAAEEAEEEPVEEEAAEEEPAEEEPAEEADTEEPATEEESAAEEEPAEEEAAGPNQEFLDDFLDADYVETDSGLQVAILEEGDGDLPQAGGIVAVDYTGYLDTGQEFDSSASRGPFEFPLGQGRVIQGWDEGIAMLPVGSSARLVIPSDLAYGEQGAPPVIPPGATLYFEVELLEAGEPLPPPPEAPTEFEEDEYEETESGLRYAVLEEGDGDAPQSGDFVSVHYTGWLDDGTMFDSSLLRGEPLSFPLGQGLLIEGWEEGISLMQVGDQFQLVIPPELGFGEQGSGDVIPPDATLIFEVELVEVNSPQGAPGAAEEEAEEIEEDDADAEATEEADVTEEPESESTEEATEEAE